METAPLKSFATWARTALLREVSARISVVLASEELRQEQPNAVAALEKAVTAAGGGDKGRDAVADKGAYTWFNRIIALRFMDANGYTGIGVVSPERGREGGQPEVLAEAKRGNIDSAVVTNKRTAETITSLLNGMRRSDDPQGEAYALLLAEYCRHWNRAMPFMFEREGDYTELLIPANLLADDSVLARATTVLTEDVCQDVEVIGWLYQFYISERKEEVFAGFKKNKKAGADEIPAATQLFTPHWIVRYLVENSLGRLWMLNQPTSRLVDQMDYYIAPVDKETDFLKITGPEKLTVMDPACGSGHMLTYAFDLLYAIYEEAGYAPSEIPGLILTHNLHGTEIDPRAGSLAAFALTMKARGKQRTFFNKQIEPNICVIEPISFGPDELDFLVTRGGVRHEEEAFWNQFVEADSLGALVQPDRDLTIRLAQHTKALQVDKDLINFGSLEASLRCIKQAEFLSKEYTIVVANPPYMGSRNMTDRLGTFVKEAYPVGKQDLYGCFILRSIQLAGSAGIVAMVVGDTWMSIRSFEDLRKLIVRNHAFTAFIHCRDVSLHADIFGANTAFVLNLAADEEVRAPYFRLEPLGDEPKRLRLIEALRSPASRWRFEASVSDFSRLPGAPIAYWLPHQVRAAMMKSRQIGDVVSFPTSPHKTGDNTAYVRRWWEASVATVGPHARWVPYAKGGGSRRWFGLMYDVVDWSPEALRFYSENSSSSLMKRDPDAPEGITYSMLTSGTNTFRVLPPGAAFDMGGPGFFSKKLSVEQVLAVVNSDMTRMVLEALNPTLNLQLRDVKQVPVPDFDQPELDRLHLLGAEAIGIAQRDWDLHECALEFQGDPVAASSSGVRLEDTVADLIDTAADQTKRLSEIEREIDELMWGAAGVEPSQRGEVGKRAILFGNSEVEFGAGRKTSEYRSMAATESITRLVSYAVGCIFGRYSLDEPGLILADQGSTLQEYLAKIPAPIYRPDADNVIPFVDDGWFGDDIVERFRQFLRVAFGTEHFEENLRFVQEALGVKTLRDYFITKAGKSKFYDDHVQRYKKRPIYWLFSSPKGSFNALIYMHRYTPSTASTVLNEYLREFKAKLDASRQHHERLAAGTGAPREQAAAQKEVDRLRKVLLELDEYEHDVLYPLASQQVPIDLDDGVKANYPKLGAALKKIPGLEADS
ncbi:BREX-1 system adenine-specific DNA-methyltransferase PglX [Arthrobacter sp. K5]|uniref:site-specific DNA-methyltransferase (adenine-specific) n=1 Tax=Arthrobacter sp. K5 TaxID=2839623 RepID=A0AAU8ERT8_9MICC